MTPFEESILKQLKEFNRLTGPTTGTRMAELIGRPIRTVIYYLRRLEDLGKVSRPYGRCSGWVVI